MFSFSVKELRKTVFSVLFILFTLSLNAQTNAKENSIEGTYQVQVVNSRNQPNLPGNLSEIVKANRHLTERKYVKLGDEVRLMILPESEIRKTNFKPLKQIAYVVE